MPSLVLYLKGISTGRRVDTFPREVEWYRTVLNSGCTSESLGTGWGWGGGQLKRHTDDLALLTEILSW